MSTSGTGESLQFDPELYKIRMKKNELKSNIDKLSNEVSVLAEKVGGVSDNELSVKKTKLMSDKEKYTKVETELKQKISVLAGRTADQLGRPKSDADLNELEKRKMKIENMMSEATKEIAKLKYDSSPSIGSYITSWYREPSDAEVAQSTKYEEAIAEKEELMHQLENKLANTKSAISARKGELASDS